MQNRDDHINTKSPYEVIPIIVTTQKLYIVTGFPDQLAQPPWQLYLFATPYVNDTVEQNLQSCSFTTFMFV